MRISLKVAAIVAVVGLLGMSKSVEAGPIVINPADYYPTLCGVADPVCLAGFGDQTSQAQIDPIIAALIPGAEVEGYKQNVGEATDSGPGAPFYQTTFSNSPSDPSDALVQWTGGSFFTTNPLFLLVKDGNQSPAWYLFQLAVGGATGWNGKDNLVLEGFWPNQGAISHIAIYGTPTPGTDLFDVTPVPDGGSMAMLLGMGLMGLAALRRVL